ncbi:relaxase/mobilization nuclease domain-containing protein [Pseudomonas sp. NPDC088885]|uniref:relaxase/mobilization nuclease domain-containing protein n=1 Tax=Pseudomonas sp. NPDC088885 TaxID=3364457 RepID=UPI0037F6DA53
MINKMMYRKGGGNRTRSSANYLLKLNPEGDAIDCTIPRLEGESNMEYATRIKNVFEGDRVHNQKNLYQFNMLSLHPSEGDKFTDAQMIQMAKEVYLKNGVKNSLNDNRHYLFVVERNTEHHHVHAMIHLTDLETKKVNNKMIDYNPIIKKLELKYGLYNEHRKPKDEDEYKKTFKKELKAILDNALNPSEFLMLANAAGFDIHHSGKDAYSMTKDGQTFKASDLAVSYKTLKAALGDDPEFAATLASLHTDKAGNEGSVTIAAPTNGAPTNQPQKPPAQDHEPEPEPQKSYSNYGSQASNESRKEMADFYKGLKMQKTLYKNYHYDDQGNYYYNINKQKAFEFDATSGTVTHRNVTPSSAKAGLQKLTEDGNPSTLYTSGGEKYRREIWMQFNLMKLDEKGYTLKGYKPSKKDIEELQIKLDDQTKFYNRPDENNVKSLPVEKAPLEKLKLENADFKKPIEQSNIKALPVEKAPEIADEKPSIGATAENTALKGAGIAVEGVSIVAEGVLSAAVDVFTSKDVVGVQAEMLAEMAALDREARSQQQSAENEAHQNERRRLQQLKPH